MFARISCSDKQQSLLVVELHQSHNLDSGVVVALEHVSVSHDHRAVEDILIGIVLVDDVFNVVDGVGLAALRIVGVGYGGVQILEQLSKGFLRVFGVLLFFL